MCDPPGVNVTSQKRNVMVQKINTIRQLTADQQSRSNIVVAASGFVMADGQSQDPMLAQVRLRNGDYAYVKDLPKIDHDDRQPNGDYMIPLVLNHSGDSFKIGELDKFAQGGHVRGRGTGTSDSIPAMVSNGEYVVKANAVRNIGLANMELINQGELPRRGDSPIVGEMNVYKDADPLVLAQQIGSMVRFA